MAETPLTRALHTRTVTKEFPALIFFISIMLYCTLCTILLIYTKNVLYQPQTVKQFITMPIQSSRSFQYECVEIFSSSLAYNITVTVLCIMMCGVNL